MKNILKIDMCDINFISKLCGLLKRAGYKTSVRGFMLTIEEDLPTPEEL